MVKAKNVKSGKVSKSKKEKVVVEKKVDEVVEVAPVDPVVASLESPVNLYASEFEELVKMADTMNQMAREFKSRVTKLQKTVAKEHKQLEKRIRGKKRRATNPDAPPSGFAKPGPVSDELRKFLGLSKDELIARTEVTKAINEYCKKHSLQNESDKRKILPDAPLRKLLKMKKSDDLTFFNLQTYLKVHFPNKEGVYPVA
tara:strand:- start:182 stop:781 length:600 start_codon:yes stop_codon:yes gene_type:complete